MPSLADYRRLSRARRTRRRQGRGAGFAAQPLAVTFPASLLTARVYIALGADLTASRFTWNWLDITSRVRHDLGVTITPGRREESTLVTPSEAVLKIDNNDGYFSRLNPLSPYYGQLTKNTPIWISVDPGSGFIDRYFGYVNEWPNRWADASGTDATLTIRCAGVLRRLAQGSNLKSCLHRAILADNPVHYWRLDDPDGTTQAASSLPNGGRTMTATNMGWRDLASPPGGDGETSAAKLNSATLLAENLAVAAPWTVEWSILRPSDGTLDGDIIFSVRFTAAGATQQIDITTTLDSAVSARDWYHYKLEGTQNGANWEVNWWKNGIAQGMAGPGGAGTMGTFDEIIPSGYGIAASDFSVAYVAAYQGLGVDAQVHSDALQAFSGELAHKRIIRLCGEENIPIVALAPTSAAMGPQGRATFIELLRECETADQGVLFEHEFGLRYQSLYERCNQPVSLALDFDQGHIAGTPNPADDDQRLRNQWTVARSNGTTPRTADDDESIAASGLYDDSVTANLEADGQLLDHASWRVHVGTVDEDRWPYLGILLHGTPGLIPAWAATQLGARVTVDNPPAQMAPDQIDQILEGYTERFDTVSWGAVLNLSPASPYDVAVLDDPLLGRLDSASSTIDAALSDSAMSFTVATTNSADLWTTDAAEFPLDIRIGGEKIRLSGISGASSPQTFSVSARSVNGVVKSHAAGAAVHVDQPAILAL